ncbi:hypothetical protein Tsubulata_026284 [Turnera subulata]|uniref:Uncharacterized protein n=1 Tax=Turnera subulata TaxID=218843 RepID=A0A9Q0FNJ1_9ROSI|nr:hypothetical protein Tsubulata_026284 [Turnera subulata]
MIDKGPWKNPDIIDMIQSARATEEVNGNEAINGVVSDEPMGIDQSKSSLGANLKSLEELESQERKSGEKLEARKIQALEAAIAETTAKIQALEAALEDTKMALKGLAQHLKELRA